MAELLETPWLTKHPVNKTIISDCYSLLHKGFNRCEFMFRNCTVNPANVYTVKTATTEIVLGGGSRIFVASHGVKNIITVLALAKNLTTRALLAVYNEDQEIAWEEIESVVSYKLKPDDKFRSLIVAGINQAVIIDNVFVV